MSGGSYNYAFGRVSDMADEMDRRAAHHTDSNTDVGNVAKMCHTRRVYDAVRKVWMTEEESVPVLARVDVTRAWFAEHLRLVSAAMQAVEWVDSDDCGPGDEVTAIEAVRDHARKP